PMKDSAKAFCTGLRFDQRRADALRDDPRQQSIGYELRPVIAAQERRGAACADQAGSTSMTWAGRVRPSSSMARAPLVDPSGTVGRQLQASAPPQPICPARAHAVAVAPEKDADATITVARILPRQLLHPLHTFA